MTEKVGITRDGRSLLDGVMVRRSRLGTARCRVSKTAPSTITPQDSLPAVVMTLLDGAAGDSCHGATAMWFGMLDAGISTTPSTIAP